MKFFLKKKQHIPDDNTIVETTSAKSIKKTNIYILIAAIVMIGMSVAGIILSSRKPKIEPKENVETVQPVNTLVKADPELEVDPESINMDDIVIGSTSQKVIAVSAKDAALTIKNIELSPEINDLQINEDCSEKMRPRLDANETCTIPIEWSPKAIENRELFVIITWIPIKQQMQIEETENTNNVTTANKPVQEEFQTKKIRISLSSIEPVVAENEEVELDEKEEEKTIVREKIEDALWCKKYAAKARDFVGTFIGWIQTNMNVYDPNCVEVIGVLQDNGDIITPKTGEIIGKGPVLKEGNVAMEDRAIQELPEGLDADIFAADDEEKAAAWEGAMGNRYMAKFDPNDPVQGRLTQIKGDGGMISYYQADDPFGILGQLETDSVVGIESGTPTSEIETFVLRRNKPIHAVLTTPIRAKPLTNYSEVEEIPVSAVVEQNVYGGKGRTIIIPAGSVVMGIATPPDLGDEAPLSPFYKMDITWDTIIRPDGARFDLAKEDTVTGDAQGRLGVPGKADTGYMRKLFLNPLLYSILPAAVNLISPSTAKYERETLEDAIANAGTGDVLGALSADADYEKVTTEMSSKEKAKSEIIENWKKVSTKLVQDSMNNTTPEFIVPAGTRVTIFPQQNLVLNFTEDPEEIKEYVTPPE